MLHSDKSHKVAMLKQLVNTLDETKKDLKSLEKLVSVFSCVHQVNLDFLANELAEDNPIDIRSLSNAIADLHTSFNHLKGSLPDHQAIYHRIEKVEKD